MINTYVNRLIDIQGDRKKYQKQRDKNMHTSKMNKQQSKYHAYIIDQMNQRNKLIAANRFINILQAHFIQNKNQSFRQIYKSQSFCTNKSSYKQQSYSQLQSRNSFCSIYKEEFTMVESALLNYSIKSIVKISQKYQSQLLRVFFIKVKAQINRQKILNKLSKNIAKYHCRHTFRSIYQTNLNKKQGIMTQAKIFDGQFSAIYKTERNRCYKSSNRLQQSYLSFILQKQKSNYQDKQQYKENLDKSCIINEQMTNLKKQLSYIKILLSQKTIQLKKKIQQCDNLKKKMQNDNKSKSSNQNIQSQHSYSRNISYYQDLQMHILGGKIIQKNTKKSLNNISNSKQQVSKQLLGKYMRECFQLKETIDIACQLCYDLQHDLRAQDKKSIGRIIKVLNSNQQYSLADQI